MEKITEEVQQVLVRRAQGVRDAIAASGLPAHLAGSSANGLDVREFGGAIVYYSPAADDSSGVYAYWRGAPETVAAAKAALMGGGGPEGAAARQLLAVVLETMNEALVTVLEAQGWRVVKVDMGGAEELSVTTAG